MGQIITVDLEITHKVSYQSTGLFKISIHLWVTLKDSASLVPHTLHNPWSLHLLITVSVGTGVVFLSHLSVMGAHGP